MPHGHGACQSFALPWTLLVGASRGASVTEPAADERCKLTPPPRGLRGCCACLWAGLPARGPNLRTPRLRFPFGFPRSGIPTTDWKAHRALPWQQSHFHVGLDQGVRPVHNAGHLKAQAAAGARPPAPSLREPWLPPRWACFRDPCGGWRLAVTAPAAIRGATGHTAHRRRGRTVPRGRPSFTTTGRCAGLAFRPADRSTGFATFCRPRQVREGDGFCSSSHTEPLPPLGICGATLTCKHLVPLHKCCRASSSLGQRSPVSRDPARRCCQIPLGQGPDWGPSDHRGVQ